MKKIFAFIAFLSAISFQYATAQDTTAQHQLAQVLNNYYKIKDALVDENSANASMSAGELIKVLNTIDYKIITEGNVNALLKDASLISDTKDLKVQRSHFANFSSNMATLAKAFILTYEPVYLDYCPMKKAYWLSSDKSIKNPYYGNMMLTCGEITETIIH